MIGTKYLSEAVDINNLETEKLNIIKAPNFVESWISATQEITVYVVGQQFAGYL